MGRNDNRKVLVRLRAMEPEDLDVLYAIENDRKLWDVGCTNVPYSRFTLHNYIADCVNDIYTDKQLRLMVVDEKGEVVGIVDLMNFDPRHQRAEVGVVIKKSCRRHGFATAAVKRLMDYAFNNLHLHQLYVLADAENSGSVALFSSLGFQKHATLCEWLYKDGQYRDAILMQYLLDSKG